MGMRRTATPYVVHILLYIVIIITTTFFSVSVNIILLYYNNIYTTYPGWSVRVGVSLW